MIRLPTVDSLNAGKTLTLTAGFILPVFHLFFPLHFGHHFKSDANSDQADFSLVPPQLSLERTFEAGNKFNPESVRIEHSWLIRRFFRIIPVSEWHLSAHRVPLPPPIRLMCDTKRGERSSSPFYGRDFVLKTRCFNVGVIPFKKNYHFEFTNKRV